MRRDDVKDIAKLIIDNQYKDNKYSIENHFLRDTINEMVLQLAPKIKSHVDQVFDHALKNKLKKYDDQHHCDAIILINDKTRAVMLIHDESSYGPDLNYIMVYDDKVKGSLHIRKIKNFQKPSYERFLKKDWKFNGFNDAGFIFTFHYVDEMYKRMSEILDAKALAKLPQYLKVEEMGWKTFQLWDSVEYSNCMITSILRIIDNEKN